MPNVAQIWLYARILLELYFETAAQTAEKVIHASNKVQVLVSLLYLGIRGAPLRRSTQVRSAAAKNSGDRFAGGFRWIWSRYGWSLKALCIYNLLQDIYIEMAVGSGTHRATLYWQSWCCIAPQVESRTLGRGNRTTFSISRCPALNIYNPIAIEWFWVWSADLPITNPVRGSLCEWLLAV